MSAPDVMACALWLQRHIGAHLFAVDHPGLPACAGAHRQPCDGQRGKHPCGRWSRDSTSDAALIADALSRGLRNIGIDCGKSGLLVVDEDRPGAFSAFALSIDQEIPPTFTVATSKGHHFYFRQPPATPLGNGRGLLAGMGIDIRGAGGFVVAPGSVHTTGIVYTPADPAVSVAAAPGWLATALRPPDPAEARPRIASSGGTANGRFRGIVAVVLDAPVGERNNSLHWAACRFAELISDGQIDYATAADLLARAGESAGLGSAEVAATVASGLRAVSA